MHTFVRIHRKNSTDYGTWFLRPKSVEEINEHWQTVCGHEIHVGMQEITNKAAVKDGELRWKGHIISPFALNVLANMDIKAMMNNVNMNFLEGCLNVENEAYRSRVECFNKGKQIYLAEGMTVYMLDDRFFEIVESVNKHELIYPTRENYTLDDVRYMQWSFLGNKGEHWYAKIGKRDIVDKHGNMKWNTKEDAEQAAKWFFENKM